MELYQESFLKENNLKQKLRRYKTNYKRMKITTLILFIGLFYTTISHAQELITQENYLKQDSLLWMEYQHQQDSLSQCWETLPGKRDSIQQIFDRLLKETRKKNVDLAIRYASVPSGLKRLYMLRLDVPKDTLNNILNSLNTETQQSFYGKNIYTHIHTQQIRKDDSVYFFPCTQVDGEKFDWNITNGKQLLILYGGMGCMGEAGREYLKQLYEKTSRNDFLILVYWPCSSLEELQEAKKQYPSDYIFISDFKQDAGPMSIKYGAQATPTCFLTDNRHIIKTKCIGIHTELFDKLINHKKQ